MEALRSAYYESLKPGSLAPLWTVLKDLVTARPTSSHVANLWRYDDVRPQLMRAGELITAQEAERRVLILENPGCAGSASLTSTLYGGLQLILPGEVAPCHRHSQSALRFVLEGSGAYTAVDGEPAVMECFDLVLTPNGRWHDHANDTDQPVIWLDGLDIPLVTALSASFAEHLSGATQHQKTFPPGRCQTAWGANMRSLQDEASELKPEVAPLFHYPYAKWGTAMKKLADTQVPDTHFGYAMEFTNPLTGGSVMTTMSAFAYLLPAGFRTEEVRSTDGTIYVGVEGAGRIEVGGMVFEVGPRDVVVAPSWQSRRIHAHQDLILFAYSDRAAQKALNLWRQELC